VMTIRSAVARLGDRGGDAAGQRVAGYARCAVTLGRCEDRAVDGGIRLTGRFGEWLAAFGERRGESLFDGAAMAVSQGTGWLGERIRRLQSGQMHHYYTGIAVGLAAVFLILAIGGQP